MIDFVHIGLHKTATTWLQRGLFRVHPHLSVIGARREFQDLTIAVQILATADELDFDLDAWRDSFEIQAKRSLPTNTVSGISAEDLCGHMITGAMAARNAKRLAGVLGPTKILLVLRDPISYIRSMYMQYVKNGGASPLRALLTDPVIPGKAIPRRINYRPLVSQYRSLFGETNVLVLPYELLVRDATRFLRCVCEFLQVEAIDDDCFSERPNVGLSALSLGTMRLGNYLGIDRHAIRRWAERFDRRLGHLAGVAGDRISYELLRQFKGGALYPGFAGLLCEQNYAIWSGELAEFNYKFSNPSISGQ